MRNRNVVFCIINIVFLLLGFQLQSAELYTHGDKKNIPEGFYLMSEEDSVELKPLYIRANFLLPGLSVEKSIFNYKNTLNFGIGYGLLRYWENDISLGSINLEFRHYYNIHKRLIKGKSIKYYNANYLSVFAQRTVYRHDYVPHLNPPSSSYATVNFFDMYVGYHAGVNWGGNIVFWERFYFNYSIGVWYRNYLREDYWNTDMHAVFSDVIPMGQLKLGVNL